MLIGRLFAEVLFQPEGNDRRCWNEASEHQGLIRLTNNLKVPVKERNELNIFENLVITVIILWSFFCFIFADHEQSKSDL